MVATAPRRPQRAGCSAVDRAGGKADEPVKTLTFAQPNGRRRTSCGVGRARRGGVGRRLVIEFRNEWQNDDPNAEVDTLDDVKAGKADLAWVGARAFDPWG